MTLGVRALVENSDGKVLLVHHTYTKGWYMPGGGVERGEPALSALERELVEEAGVTLTRPPEIIGIYSNHRIFKNDHVVLYRVRPDGWTPCEATSQGEISDIEWCDPLSPPDTITDGNRRRLLEIFGNGAQEPYW